MKNNQIFNEISFIYKTCKTINIVRKIKINPIFVQEINNNTCFLHGDDCTFSSRIYCYINNITEYPKCRFCGNTILNKQFINIKEGFAKYCSAACRHSNPDTKKLCACSKLLRHGNAKFVNPEKSRQTRYQKNNGNWHADDFVFKSKLTKQNNYGDAGYNNHAQAVLTNLKKIGVETPLALTNFRRNGDKTEFSFYEILLKNKYDIPIFSFDDYINRKSEKDLLLFECLTCHRQFKAIHDNGIHRKCPYCFPADSTISDLNRRIYKILNTANIEYQPEYFLRSEQLIRFYDIRFYTNIFLEINGDYWHANPSLYNDNEYLILPGKGHILVSDIHKRDLEKRLLAESYGFSVKYLWESDMKKMSDTEILVWIQKNCLNMFNDNFVK